MRQKRLIPVFLLWCAALAGCGPTHWVDQNGEKHYTRPSEHLIAANEVCNDPTYLELKSKPLDQMTEREYEYFLLKERQCQEAQQHHAVIGEIEKNRDAWSDWIVATAILSVIGTAFAVNSVQ